MCGQETIDFRLMRCLDVKNIQEITIKAWSVLGIDFGIFTFGYAIEHIKIFDVSNVFERKFENASFSNMSSLRSVKIANVTTSDLLNFTFQNVPSLTSLTIENYNFTLFPNRPFRELTNLLELYIRYGELRELPEGLFYNLYNLTILSLVENKIESIHPLVFRNLTKLVFLDLHWNRIKHLPSDMLSGLSNLRVFFINLNRISEIPSGFFKKLYNLTIFFAFGSSLSSLEEDIFSDLINLKTVYLNLNQIEYLPPNLLSNNKLMTNFSCSYNKISTIPTGIFRGLSELRMLELEGNRLENLPEEVFRSLSSLKTLKLSNNRLTFLHENIFFPLTNLMYLDLSNNNLTEIIGERPFGSSKHLNYLKLKNAGLTQWPMINWTEYDLTEVDFSNNHFETVKLPIYTPNRMVLNVSNCKIRTIYVDDWKYGFQMPYYYLSNNEITCDHKLQQFVLALKSNIEVARKIFPNIENTKCYGKERNLLGSTSFVVIGNYCPMNCECFAEKNHVKVNCSEMGINVIPEVLVPNTTIVDLSNNYVKDLSNVDSVTWKNVTYLRLSNNSISNISDYVLMPNLKFLWLDGNRLSELPPGLMNLIDVSSKFKIYLSGNNWTCHCHSQFTKDWLLRNRQKIADFSDVFCARNSSSLSFTEIVYNDGCREIPEDNLASSVNDSVSNEDRFDEDSPVFGWKIAVAVLTSLMLIGVIIVVIFVYYRRKPNNKKEPKTNEVEIRLKNKHKNKQSLLSVDSTIDEDEAYDEDSKTMLSSPQFEKYGNTFVKGNKSEIRKLDWLVRPSSQEKSIILLTNTDKDTDKYRHKQEKELESKKGMEEIGKLDNNARFSEENHFKTRLNRMLIGPIRQKGDENKLSESRTGSKICRETPSKQEKYEGPQSPKSVLSVDIDPSLREEDEIQKSESTSHVSSQEARKETVLSLEEIPGDDDIEETTPLLSSKSTSPKNKKDKNHSSSSSGAETVQTMDKIKTPVSGSVEITYSSASHASDSSEKEEEIDLDTDVKLSKQVNKTNSYEDEIYDFLKSSGLQSEKVSNALPKSNEDPDSFEDITTQKVEFPLNDRAHDLYTVHTTEYTNLTSVLQMKKGCLKNSNQVNHCGDAHNRSSVDRGLNFKEDFKANYILNKLTGKEVEKSEADLCTILDKANERLIEEEEDFVKKEKIKFTDCYPLEIDFGIFTFGYGIERVQIWYEMYQHKRNFESASFNNVSSLRSVEIVSVKTSELVNLTFHNVPSLTSLKIEYCNFTFPSRPFRELINLSELYITGGKLKVLPEDLFYNLHNLTKLDLSHNNIESIHPLVFRNLVRLEYLYLQWNQIKDLPSDMLKGLSNLRTFYIYGNRRLSQIPSGFFKKLHNLTEISAWNCSFSLLEDDVFSDLINLKTVYLTYNQIEYLPPNLLRNNKLLTVFFCSYNKISNLPTRIFNGLSELQLLNLKGNRLENFPEDIFQNLSSLQNLDLSKNRLTFLHENIFLPLTNLTYLSLSYNNLTKLTDKRPFGSSKHLRVLGLNYAGLTEWPVINWTEYDWIYVDFSNNHFESVNLPIYTPNRVQINLSNCKIRTIYIDEWKYGFQMPTYDLSNNEITCDFKLQQFLFALKSNIEVAKEMFPGIENTKCYGEEKSLLDNTSFVVVGNYCPMKCECSAEENHVMVNCSGKKIDRIPHVLVPNATIVDLRNNYIKDLSTVDSVTWLNVTHLLLSNNLISNISDYVLLPNLKYVMLDGNRLTQLPSGLMNLIDVSPEFKIYLSRNTLNCHCHSQFTKNWLLRNRRKISDFTRVFCTRNSSSVSFTEIVSNDRCKQVREVNFASSVNVSCIKCVSPDEVSSVFGWKIAVALLTSVMLFSWIVFAYFLYCGRKGNVEKVPKPKEEEVIYYNVCN
ncbi:uncharacterized protein [Centruroides vittatus]|uniref:uncharacterized protein n=1 Tax=Centruroides vittatus TaxID=120091 RepID=UPI0035107C0C